MDTVEQMLAENQAKADMILQTNPGVVEAYNERKTQVCLHRFLTVSHKSRLKIYRHGLPEGRLI